jgi:hypothetical protein
VKDLIVVATLVLAFASLLTAHVTIAYGLARRPPRWRALAALFVPPMAPLWAWRERMRVRTIVWVAALSLYIAARIVSRL